MSENSIVNHAKAYVRNLFDEQLDAKYIFHDFEHTTAIAESCKEIAKGSGLNDDQREVLLLAAWFHDTGYIRGTESHEEESVKIALEFLKPRDYPDEKLKLIEGCILATKIPQNPKTPLEKGFCDADLSHIGKVTFFDSNELLRGEWELTEGKVYSDTEWLELELDFMTNHQFHTMYAKERFNSQKNKNIVLLQRDIRILKKDKEGGRKRDEILQKDFERKKKKSQIPERGIETMFRVSMRTHIDLSAIADNKANIMLSINAIIISITLSILVPNFKERPELIFPTTALVLVCLVAIIYATLSTRPKITDGKFTREDIHQKRSNLLFFGNFHGMKWEDYEWGMKEMMNDRDFLYTSMIRDFYALGKVLHRKYKFLRICYNVFMYGLIMVVLLFGFCISLT